MRRALLPCALAYVVCPWGAGRLWLAALVLVILCQAARDGVNISPRSVGLAALVTSYVILVVSPYWMLPSTWPARALALAASAAWSVAWSRLAARPLRAAASGLPTLAAFGMAAAALAWLWPSLAAPIEYRGDEDFHLAAPLAAVRALRAAGASAAIPAFLLITGIVFSSRVRRTALMGLLVAPLGAALLFAAIPPEPEVLARFLRYGTAAIWVHTASALSPAFAWPPFDAAAHDERLYRVIPCLSLLALSLSTARWMRGPVALKVVTGLAVATTPALAYYGTSVYPELTAVALLAAGLLGIHASARRLLAGRADPSGSAILLAAGLALKDAAIATGLAVVAYYWVASLRRPRQARWRDRLRLAAVVLGPAAFYLGWRLAAPHWLPGVAQRSYAPDASALANPALYALAGTALAQQFGCVLLGAAAGVIVARNRGMLLVALLAQLLLFATDTVVATERGALPAYWGYSRFFVLAFPPIACLFVSMFRKLARRAPRTATVAATLVLAVNVWSAPIHRDGSRALWGDYVSETSGMRYPYDALYRWLAASGAAEVAIVGRDYSYRDDFYLRKHALSVSISLRHVPAVASRLPFDSGPRRAVDAPLLQALSEEAAAGRAQVVVAHVNGCSDPARLPPRIGALRFALDLRLGACGLRVYRRE
jgi:hypothetical protein